MVHRTRRRRWKGYKPIRSTPKATLNTTVKTEIKKETTVSDKQFKSKQFDVKNLESVNRITTLPIVESGWFYAENFYNKIKKSNNLFYWTLQQAESSIFSAVETALPAIVLFQGPISSIDKILCKSLDIVEKTVPSINLPPEMIYWNTKQYVTDVSTKIVRPVLKRADSVKSIGNTVLSSKYTTFAADTLDGALDVADKYVDKYLPAAVYEDQVVDEDNNATFEGPTGKAIQTFHHVGRFSGKLQRRLTKRTFAEAKALKEQSAEAIHVLIYVAELIATDPKLAFEKGKELWASLSKDEPENQARPENLEQLLVLITRESSRRIVHFINFTSEILSKIPRKLSNSIYSAFIMSTNIANSIVKSVHLEGVQRVLVTGLQYQARHFTLVLKQLNAYITDVLEQMAQSLNTPEQPKAALEVPKIKVQLRAVHHKVKNSNGVESNKNL